MGDLAAFLWCAVVGPPLRFCKNLIGKCIISRGFFVCLFCKLSITFQRITRSLDI